MKAVVLAAGIGSRLRPITDSVPKCMVAVNGIRIIDKQIDNLLKAGIRDIYVVSGYKAEILNAHILKKYPFVTMVLNQRYAETNNMYSLFLTEKYVNGEDFLLMNADVYFDVGIVEGMVNGTESKIACDKSLFLDESMKITLDGDKVNHIGKNIKEKDHYAVSIDVYRLNAVDSSILFSEIKDTIIGKKDENSWTEVALDRIFKRTNFKPYVIGGRWFEIDCHEDLVKAESIFRGDTLSC